MVVPNYYENLQVLHENTMPNRAYYIPASFRCESLVEHREHSDRFQLLSGEWRFRYYKSIYDVEKDFFLADAKDEQFCTVRVPGVWQMYGFDTHQYTNIKYPFPFDPPFVPKENPCGCYVREFEYHTDEKAPVAYLNFEGVDSCFYVWLNGTYMGYSQVSHSTSEFDITANLHEGKNKLVVLVLKWCDGSYLEDQDKFRMSGIFRDVYILKRPKDVVMDYFVHTSITGDMAKLRLDLKYHNQPIATKVSLLDEKGKIVAFIEKSDFSNGDETSEYPYSVDMAVMHPKLWNPEAPYLYTLLIETTDEVITDAVGFREIYIRDKRVMFNGQAILFQGLNRHDSDADTGFAISIEQMKKDLYMMKQHNFNAIRTSHYPNAPMFYQLCDKYGFWVIDEADSEAHGASERYLRDTTEYTRNKRWNEMIADNPAFTESVVDRVKRCVHRDKNRPCVCIWSMGNESAYGCTYEAALKWTKEFDPDRLTHYESARYRDYEKTYDFSKLDLYSRMYPALDEIKEYLSRNSKKPMILCEYCHSMGNGPGDLEDYFQMFQAEEAMCGGFVWEWCDHGIHHGQAKDGREIYYYGGDHEEVQHDSNFCMDGLVYPDRTPHTGLLEYKNVYRPVRAIDYDEEKHILYIKNMLQFTNLKAAVTMRYEVNCDGIVVEKGRFNTPSVEPLDTAAIELKMKVPESGRVYLKVYYDSLGYQDILEKGYPLGFDELLLKNSDMQNQIAAALRKYQKSDEIIHVEEDAVRIYLSGAKFNYVYNKHMGAFEQMTYDGTAYLNAPMHMNIWRAPTDNDMYRKLEWMRACYDKAYVREYETTCIVSGHEVKIKAKLSMVAAYVQKIMDIDAVWTIKNNGAVHVVLQVEKDPEFPELPRFGLRLFLNKGLNRVSYYGMGPQESYVDKHRASSHGLYTSRVKDMLEDYIRPQENGSHWDCDYVVLENNKKGLAAVCENKTFSFHASVYSQEELTRKRHNFELVPEKSTVLCLDYAQNGIGSNSCGPLVLPQYTFDETEFVFELHLVPFCR